MSHVVTMNWSIKDLACLKKACEALGLEFIEGQQTFKWYGTHVGDYPLPTGFSKEDMGKCDHAIRVKGNANAYEVGVCKRRDGKPGYVLMYDFWSGGRGLMDAIGNNAGKVKQQYGLAVATKMAKRKGLHVVQVKQANGDLVLELRG